MRVIINNNLDENKTFGKKNKPRNEEPNMFDIMKWP